VDGAIPRGLDKVLLVLGQRTGDYLEDRTKFYWSWARGLVLNYIKINSRI
jgi:hypothetical protein